jgi:hypothetical protein
MSGLDFRDNKRVNIRNEQKKPSDIQIKYDENKALPRFDFEQFPVGYFADNARGKDLRKQLIVNQTRTAECTIGDLENTFFSEDNIALINKQLILTVFRKTKGGFLICPQKEENLIIVMRYVWIEYSKNLPYQIKEQIIELNCRVISEILPTVISNVDQKLGYMRDISTQPVGPPLPINTKNLERTLPSISNMLTMKDSTPTELSYTERVEQESNIQGLPGLEGFIY